MSVRYRQGRSDHFVTISRLDGDMAELDPIRLARVRALAVSGEARRIGFVIMDGETVVRLLKLAGW